MGSRDRLVLVFAILPAMASACSEQAATADGYQLSGAPASGGDETTANDSSGGVSPTSTTADTADTADTEATTTSGDTEGCIPVCEGRSCGPDGCDGICGTCENGDACTDDGQCEAPLTVLYVFDQQLDGIVRLEDRDGDGRMNGADETQLFFNTSVPVTGVGNAQGLVADGPNRLWATDNFAPSNLVRLEDQNGDGNAFGAGESAVFFSGPLPGGYSFDNPTSIHRLADGTVYFTHNNGLEISSISGIFRLQDLDANGNADGPGEASTVWQLSAPGSFDSSILDVAIADANTMYYLEDIGDEPAHVDRLDVATGQRVRFLDGGALYQNLTLFLPYASVKIAWMPSTSEVVLQAADPVHRVLLIAARDIDGDGVIANLQEIRILVDEKNHPEMSGAGSMNDFVVAEDGTLFWITALSNSLWAAYDTDGNGTYDDVVRIYETSASAGIALPHPQTIAVYRGPANP